MDRISLRWTRIWKWIVLILTLSAWTLYAQDAEAGIDPGREDLLEWVWHWNINYSSLKPDLAINEAWLTVKSELTHSVDLYHNNDECYKCNLVKRESVPAGEVVAGKIQSKFGNHIEIRYTAEDISICRGHFSLKEEGDYWLIVHNATNTAVTCNILLANDPPNIYLPLLWAFLVLLLLTILWFSLRTAHERGWFNKLPCSKRESQDLNCNVAPSISTVTLELSTASKDNGTSLGAESKPTQAPRQRLRSLDTFRGMCLTVMIFVNYGGGGYWIFEHPPWNGLTIADLVFPWFVFIMGTSMAFSFRGMMRRQTPRYKILWKVLRRTALLFLIGYSLNSSYYIRLPELRIPGVLQRLALTYFLTALPEVLFTKAEIPERRWLKLFGDIIDFWPQWLVHFGYLGVYTGLTYGLKVPGCPRGYVGPGGMHDGGRFENCTAGAAGYIDREVLTDSHIYQWPTFKAVYGATMTSDPEGILGTFSSAFMCFLGLQMGRIIVYYKDHTSRVSRWIIWGVLTGVIGAVMCKASKEEGWIPINKNLWSVSFTFALSGMAFVLIALLYCIVDVKLWWKGQPFYYPGMNSLVIYICHSVFGTYFPIRWAVEAVHWKMMTMAMWATACWVILAYVLFTKNIFVAL